MKNTCHVDKKLYMYLQCPGTSLGANVTITLNPGDQPRDMAVEKERACKQASSTVVTSLTDATAEQKGREQEKRESKREVGIEHDHLDCSQVLRKSLGAFHSRPLTTDDVHSPVHPAVPVPGPPAPHVPQSMAMPRRGLA